MEEMKKALDHLCLKFGTRNEVVLEFSQYLDTFVVQEQRKRLSSSRKDVSEA